MSSPFDFLEALFGGGTNAGSVQGGPTLDQGFSPVAGWMVGQAFADAGPIGQYLGMVYGQPGTGIPNVDWASAQTSRVDMGDYLDFTGEQTFSGLSGDPGVGAQLRTDPGPQDPSDAQPGPARSLETLNRGDQPTAPGAPIEEVFVIGQRPDRPPGPHDWWPGMESYLATQRQNAMTGGEIQLRLDGAPPARPPRPRQPPRRAAGPRVVQSPDSEPSRPERDSGEVDPYGGSDPGYTSGLARSDSPWASDAVVAERMLAWGAWSRPENAPTPRMERGDPGAGQVGRLEAVPTPPVERSFWNRGGTGLALGAATASLGVATVMWWNPVGWVALGAALAIAGGVAATTASAVELGASYSGATTPEQDARMNRAVTATLGYSSPGGALGSVAGMVWADDPEEGLLLGGRWGGLVEGATSLPGALRAVPGLWRAALPWTKSLLLTPMWFVLSAGGGGRGGVRSVARVFLARGRIASRVRQVEYLGTTPLLERDADWARYQVFATRTRNESVFRITYVDGQQRIVLADRAQPTGRFSSEAKEGNLGQMFNEEREAHIMGQAQNYLDITSVTGGQVRYLVSTRLGASRLAQRFASDFPDEMALGQLDVIWVPWAR